MSNVQSLNFKLEKKDKATLINQKLANSIAEGYYRGELHYRKVLELHNYNHVEKFLRKKYDRLESEIIKAEVLEKYDYLNALNLIIKSRLFKTKINSYVCGTDKRPPLFKTVSFGKLGKIRFLTLGSIFIEDRNKNRLVIQIDFHDWKSFKRSERDEIEIFIDPVSKGSKKLKRTFIKILNKYINNSHLLKNQKFNSKGDFLKLKDYSWDDLILNNKVREDIECHVTNFIKNRDIFKNIGVSGNKGIIFEGPPGCGKTLTCKVIANQIEATFISVDANALEEPFQINVLYKLANKLSPTVIFIEDGDLFLTKRWHRFNNTILCEMLNCLDGLQENSNIITIITANHPELLDNALLKRPGRFDVRINFGYPEKLQRFQMLEKWFSELNVDIKADLKNVSEQLKEFSGAHIKELVKQSVMSAVYEQNIDIQKISNEYDKQKFTITESHIMKAYKTLEVLSEKTKNIGFEK